MKKPTDPKGFTLIELLVVIAIIAILAAILFPVFAQAKQVERGPAPPDQKASLIRAIKDKNGLP